MERPALQRLLRDLETGRIDIIFVYKVDRLSRSLTDFARIVEVYEEYNVSFISKTQEFQHHHVDGSADAQCPAQLCPVRAPSDRPLCRGPPADWQEHYVSNYASARSPLEAPCACAP
jgi:hypothetical protein